MHNRSSFPIHVRTRWLDYSPALHWHARRHVQAALRAFEPRIRWVNVKIAGTGAAPDRTCDIELATVPSSYHIVSASGPDAYRAVEQAAKRARTVVRRETGRAATLRQSA